MIQIKPIIVKIIQTPQDRTGLKQLGHIIYSVFGLVGVTILVSLAVGLAIGAVLFWFRKRSA